MAKTILSIETSLKGGSIKAKDLWSLFSIGSKVILHNNDTTGDNIIWCPVVKQSHKMEDQQKRKTSSDVAS
jgi:hypothetical protein